MTFWRIVLLIQKWRSSSGAHLAILWYMETVMKPLYFESRPQKIWVGSCPQPRLKRICTVNHRADMTVSDLLQNCVFNPKMKTIFRITPRTCEVYGSSGVDPASQIRPPKSWFGSFSQHLLKPIWNRNRRANIIVYNLLKDCFSLFGYGNHLQDDASRFQCLWKERWSSYITDEASGSLTSAAFATSLPRKP